MEGGREKERGREGGREGGRLGVDGGRLEGGWREVGGRLEGGRGGREGGGKEREGGREREMEGGKTLNNREKIPVVIGTRNVGSDVAELSNSPHACTQNYMYLCTTHARIYTGADV